MPRKALQPVVPGAAPLPAADLSVTAPEPGDYSDADPVPPPAAIEGNSKAQLGDGESFKHKHAHQVDASKLDRAVLTLDGWVLPLPKAAAE